MKCIINVHLIIYKIHSKYNLNGNEIFKKPQLRINVKERCVLMLGIRLRNSFSIFKNNVRWQKYEP